MRTRSSSMWLAAAGFTALAGCAQMQSMVPTQAGPQNMTFFVTSIGPGNGGDLGGLEGADRHCRSLAQAAGAGNRTWPAYLSTQSASLSDMNFVNARDRIGNGPWQNARGTAIARNVDELHSPNNNLTRETALNENGRPVKGRADTPNEHDILTGSRPDGYAFAGAPFADMTCGNRTKSGTDGIGDGRTSRSRRPRRQRVGHFLEFGASDARLRSAGTSQHRRKRAALLLRSAVDAPRLWSGGLRS